MNGPTFIGYLRLFPPLPWKKNTRGQVEAVPAHAMGTSINASHGVRSLNGATSHMPGITCGDPQAFATRPVPPLPGGDGDGDGDGGDGAGLPPQSAGQFAGVSRPFLLHLPSPQHLLVLCGVHMCTGLGATSCRSDLPLVGSPQKAASVSQSTVSPMAPMATMAQNA